MRILLITASLVVACGADAAAQSLVIRDGERAAELSTGWSVGPFSHGIESHGAVSLNGRWDLGVGFNWYSADLGGPANTRLTEWAPFVRYFLFKEDDAGAPVSVAGHVQYFRDDFQGAGDGWYAIAGAHLYKRLRLSERLALYPSVGFSVAGESFSLGGRNAERALYLTRQLGVHGLLGIGDQTWLRIVAEEQGFRRETYRALRVGLVRRF
jgi:hypothetical protein